MLYSAAKSCAEPVIIPAAQLLQLITTAHYVTSLQPNHNLVKAGRVPVVVENSVNPLAGQMQHSHPKAVVDNPLNLDLVGMALSE